MLKDKKKLLPIIGAAAFLVMILGASYSFFVIAVNNNTTSTAVQSNYEQVGQPILSTKNTLLSITLEPKMMNQSNAGTTYYASLDGTPITSNIALNNGRYILSTASVADGNVSFNCQYSYSVTASVLNEITDGSDKNIKIVFTNDEGKTKTYTLHEITNENVVYSGTFTNLTPGVDQNILVEVYVENTANFQGGLAGNEFTFEIAPLKDSAGFSCDLAKTTLAEILIDSNELWQSGLEGDGYRYIGSGAYNSETTPDNFICFGVSDKTECKNNETKYMYRIIGVFEGSDGKQHLKLISFKQLGEYAWNDTNVDIDWGASTLFTSLNGSGFLINTTYDYLQNNTWLNKIEDWTWSAVNTLTSESSGPNYYNSLTPSQIYLHEMKRSSKTSSIGEWSTPTAKIGLMYASDYTLSLGSSALSITGSTGSNASTLKTGWMHQSNNDTTKSTWERTLSRYGRHSSSNYDSWRVDSDGYVGYNSVVDYGGVRPVFYLSSDVKNKSGSGTYANPYIIKE